MTESNFLEMSLDIFRLQYSKNHIYKKWVDLLNVNPKKISRLEQIPFLPIEFFKNNKVLSSKITKGTIQFTSSSTTSSNPSHHYVTDVSLYEKSFLNCFKLFYGLPSDYCILALLPNYLQRQNSSLVYMCDRLIKDSKHLFSGFFLDDYDDLIYKINELKKTTQKVLLIGVSYALMNLSEKDLELNENFIVMETGGTKGAGREFLKEELHTFLKKRFKIKLIHSEYGMTELLSQAYSLGNGFFESPPWMKFLIREIDNPLKIITNGNTGGINVIDLANVNSCSFIATKDLGRLTPIISEKNKLELMGRYDHSDVRGCNLMLENY